MMTRGRNRTSFHAAYTSRATCGWAVSLCLLIAAAYTVVWDMKTTRLLFDVRSMTSTATIPLGQQNLLSREASSQNKNPSSCPTEGTMGLLHPHILEIDFEAIQRYNVDRLQQVRHLTVPNYEKFLTAPAGEEHYALLHYLMPTYGDCRHVVDI